MSGSKIMPQKGFSGGLFNHFRGHHRKKGCISCIAFFGLNLICLPPEKSQTLVHNSYRYVQRVDSHWNVNYETLFGSSWWYQYWPCSHQPRPASWVISSTMHRNPELLTKFLVDGWWTASLPVSRIYSSALLGPVQTQIRITPSHYHTIPRTFFGFWSGTKIGYESCDHDFFKVLSSQLRTKILGSLLLTSTITQSKNHDNTIVETYTFCTREIFCSLPSEFFVELYIVLLLVCTICTSTTRTGTST